MMNGISGMMLPRCTMKMEKMANGMKCTMMCEDMTAATMMQQMCMMNANGMMGMCCMMNGMPVCTCNMTMGMCKCEMTKKGVCISCTSGDKSQIKISEWEGGLVNPVKTESSKKEGRGEKESEENLLQKFVDYITIRKVVMLEDLSNEFRIPTKEVIDRLERLLNMKKAHRNN